MIQGHRLRQIRTQRGLSQGALAKLVATDAQYISKLERGVRVSVSTTTLERLVHALHVSADYLLGLPDQMQWTPPARDSSSTRQAKSVAATSARPTGRTANGTPPAPAPAPVAAAQPESSQAPALCPHCASNLQPVPDQPGLLACPGCRYQREEDT
jgi:transcriptional regulator with XRE-family HTH domain